MATTERRVVTAATLPMQTAHPTPMQAKGTPMEGITKAETKTSTTTRHKDNREAAVAMIPRRILRPSATSQ